MCGLISIINYDDGLKKRQNSLERIQEYFNLNKAIENKQGLMAGYYLKNNDIKICPLPFNYTYKDKNYHMIFMGELYNVLDLKKELLQQGYIFQTNTIEEVILMSFIDMGKDCLNRFDGSFAFVIDDGTQLFVARDQLGIQPLYYTLDEKTLVVSNEIKTLLAYQGRAIVNKEGVKELLALGPSMSPGKTIYKDIYSLRPGHYLIFEDQIHIHRYWQLENKVHSDDFETSVANVRRLVIENIIKQLAFDGSCATMLSGGLDSSIITAIASMLNETLATYSVSYEDQKKYFKSYDYQTTMDDNYIQEMIERYNTKHQDITLQQADLIDDLKTSVIARDMPGMADVDSSFLLFAKEISNKHKICLSGECADEIFGGYPWFYKEELYNLPYFPWLRDLDEKLDLFNDEIKALDLKSYIIEAYHKTLSEIDTADRKKQLIYLNIEWFMQTLLLRANCLTNRLDINVRVPFASKDILTYMYNMPSDFMFCHNEEKGILRKAFEDMLPEDIAHRKKNPFPKTHSPIYTDLIYEKLKTSLEDEKNILYRFFDKNKLVKFVESKGESFKAPWYGQLMMGPQLMAYMYQMYLWGKLYHIEIEL